MKPSRTSRFLALSIVAAGILTFFYPFVTTDPPVAGAARWSSFGIVLQMYNGVLPAPVCERCGEPLIRTFLALPLLVTIEYFFMVAARRVGSGRKRLPPSGNRRTASSLGRWHSMLPGAEKSAA